MINKNIPQKSTFITIFASVLICFMLAACTVADITDLSQAVNNNSGETKDETTEGQIEVLPDEETFILIEEVIVLLLFIAALVGIVARRFRVPYTLGLVVIGLLITLLPQVDVSIQPTLIFALLIPPIVFEGAFHLNINDLRRDIVPILIFAIPGVILTMGIVGALVSWGTGIPLIYTLVFGAIVAAIDPVAVIALFRNLGVPKRLQVLLEDPGDCEERRAQ